MGRAQGARVDRHLAHAPARASQGAGRRLAVIVATRVIVATVAPPSSATETMGGVTHCSSFGISRCSSFVPSRARDTASPAPCRSTARSQDADRCGYLTAEFEGILLDYSRQRVTKETVPLLLALADAAGLKGKIAAMAAGAHINVTEDRAVGHLALRAPKGATFHIDGRDVVPDVHAVLDRIGALARAIRSGELKGVTGKPLKDVVSIGIGARGGRGFSEGVVREGARARRRGRMQRCWYRWRPNRSHAPLAAGGSYLGLEFVYEALRKDSAAAAGAGASRTGVSARDCVAATATPASRRASFEITPQHPSRAPRPPSPPSPAEGRRLRFLANVDPTDVARALDGLDPGACGWRQRRRARRRFVIRDVVSPRAAARAHPQRHPLAPPQRRRSSSLSPRPSRRLRRCSTRGRSRRGSCAR